MIVTKLVMNFKSVFEFLDVPAGQTRSRVRSCVKTILMRKVSILKSVWTLPHLKFKGGNDLVKYLRNSPDLKIFL